MWVCATSNIGYRIEEWCPLLGSYIILTHATRCAIIFMFFPDFVSVMMSVTAL